MKNYIQLEYISTDQQAADILTKLIPEVKFSYFRNIISLVDLN